MLQIVPQIQMYLHYNFIMMKSAVCFYMYLPSLFIHMMGVGCEFLTTVSKPNCPLWDNKDNPIQSKPIYIFTETEFMSLLYRQVRY